MSLPRDFTLWKRVISDLAEPAAVQSGSCSRPASVFQDDLRVAGVSVRFTTSSAAAAAAREEG